MKYLSILFTFVIAYSCSEPIKTEVDMASYSIDYSKEIGVYICEYMPKNNQLSISDHHFKIIRAWVEQPWCYIDQDKTIKKFEGKAFYMEISPDSLMSDFISDMYSWSEPYNHWKGMGITCSYLHQTITEMPQTLKIILKNNSDSCVFNLTKK